MPEHSAHAYRKFGAAGQLEGLFRQIEPSRAIGDFARFQDTQQRVGGELGRGGMSQLDDGLIWFGQFGRLGK